MAALCYITDRSQFAGDESARRHRLLDKVAEAALCGVDYIQLREKDLLARDLESLAREAMKIVHDTRRETPKSQTRLLINSRTDVALSAGADGVHLPCEDIGVEQVRSIWKKARLCGAGALTHEVFTPVISVACHSLQDVAHAASSGADFALLAPIFEKKNTPDVEPAGLAALRQACRLDIPVFALGGVSLASARSCVEAGASGIAGIRLFQENSITDVVNTMRSLHA